jgi:hypothetical protein
MAYLVKAGVGLALFFGGIVLFNVELQQLLDIGTCASGNVPYEISQPCPEGTGTKILLLTGSIFMGMIGGAIFAFRGDPPWGRRERSIVGLFGYGTLAWGLFFAGTGAALLIGQPYGESVDPATGEVAGRPDSQLGSTITGVTFLIMGVPALLLGLWGVVKGLRGGERATAGAPASGLGAQLEKVWGAIPAVGAGAGGSNTGTSIDKLERLQKLKESGALSQSEFEREKAKILAE